MKWAALNSFGSGAWLLGIIYAKMPHARAFGTIDGGDHQFAIALACVAIGAAILLWANLRSAA